MAIFWTRPECSMYSSGEFASHLEQQIKDVGRGRLERVFAQSSNKRSEARRIFLRIASSKSQSSVVGLMDYWRLCMYSVGKVYL